MISRVTVAAAVLGLLLGAGALPAAAATPSGTVCDRYCDGRDPALSPGDRAPVSSTIYGRSVVLHFDDGDDMAWASIENGSPGDEVWLDRSWDGGYTWSGGSKLGDTTIPSGAQGWRTLMYNVDAWSYRPGVGAVRACGKAGDRAEITCTTWARTTWNAADSRRAAATALMAFYNDDTGLWNGTGWWNSANDLTSLVDDIRDTGMGSYRYVVDDTYDRNAGNGDFQNAYLDDTAWWALAWVDAYDLTGESRFLTTAEQAADYIHQYWDGTCGGGVWWSTARTYKNAIANELYLELNAALHNRIPGDTGYLARAEQEWSWFRSSGMINGGNLVNDGLSIASDGSCANNGQPVWSYNQGVVLQGLAELYRSTGDTGYLAAAQTLAQASTTSAALNPVSATAPQGELADPSSGGGDEPTFKGAYVRGLNALDQVVPGAPYTGYLQRQAATMYAHDRNTDDQYGDLWAGPWAAEPQSSDDPPNAAQQGSALDLLDAAG